MNQDIKEKWVENLLSGKYKQGKECLRLDNNTFCCLGVLCNLYIEENKKEWSINTDGIYSFESEVGCLSDTVLEWAGLPTVSPLCSGIFRDLVHIDKLETNLAEINDNGRSFDEIAEIIKENL